MQVPIVLCRKNTNIVIPPRQTVKTQGGKQLGYLKKKKMKKFLALQLNEMI